MGEIPQRQCVSETNCWKLRSAPLAMTLGLLVVDGLQ
jgi:hypothetical protein